MEQMAELAKFVVVLIFATGVNYAILRRLLKDFNGLGKAHRKFVLNDILTGMVLADKREDRELIAQMFRE